MVWQEDWSLDTGLAGRRAEGVEGALHWAPPAGNVAVELGKQQLWACGAAVARVAYNDEVTGSSPVTPTTYGASRYAVAVAGTAGFVGCTQRVMSTKMPATGTRIKNR